MPFYKIKLVPLRPDGLKSIGMRIRAKSRIDAQRVALNDMPFCRLHDDEPRLLPHGEDARFAGLVEGKKP